ncbi:hypothetical protein [Mycolicibacterium houstonense]|uniref:hypothetical protein n=1 Tax=Mycolicibacterium houstonense TaxID=146021 RepID=UPI003F9A10A6
MSKSDTKFEWIDAVCLDERLTVGERYVLTNTVLRYINTAYGKTFQVKQTTIADRLAVSERVVRGALGKARKYGWLILDAHRRRGAGNHAADGYRIDIPSQIPARSAANGEGIPARNVENTGTNHQEYRHETSKIPARPNSTTCENVDPKVLKEGSKEGFERGHALEDLLSQGNYIDAEVVHEPAPADPLPARIDGMDEIRGELVDADPDPEPPEFCDDHMPFGVGRKCTDCGFARRHHDRWKQRNPHHALRTLMSMSVEASSDRVYARAQALKQPSCRYCKDGGLVLMSDGTPGRNPSICNHDGSRRPATPEEIAQYETRRAAS